MARLISRMSVEISSYTGLARPPWLRWLIASAVAIVAAHLLDETAWRLVRLPTVYEKDWGRLLRSMGFLPTWLLLALAWWLQVREPVKRRAGTWLLVLGPTLGGLAAEVLKLLVRRLRPDPELFGYAFRSFADGRGRTGAWGCPAPTRWSRLPGPLRWRGSSPRALGVLHAGGRLWAIAGDGHGALPERHGGGRLCRVGVVAAVWYPLVKPVISRHGVIMAMEERNPS